MERRAFLAASTAVALSRPASLAAGEDPLAAPSPSRPLVYELRRYRMHNGTMVSRFQAT